MITHIDGLCGEEEAKALEILNDRFEETSDIEMQDYADRVADEAERMEYERDIEFVGIAWREL